MLSQGWLFFQGDVPGAQTPKFDDSGWENISVPHSWTTDKSPNYYRGVGWYRRNVHFDAVQTNKKVFLRFAAVNAAAKVYVNGNYLGEHEGGYTAFAFDIGHFVKAGENLLAVRVDNAANANIAPVGGDYTSPGGIYREVSLLKTGTSYITPLDAGGPGVYVTPLSVSAESATFSVTTKLGGSLDLPLAVQTTILAGGKVILHREESSQKANVILQKFVLPKPHLWNGKQDPYLYQVKVRLVRASEVLDEVTQNFGLRFFSVTANGFQLNGQPYPLHGVNLHQDWEGKGWALGREEHARNVDIIKELGATAVRLAHYPHADETLDLLDEAGIVVWAEIPVIDTIPVSAAFAANAKQQLRELIRQKYNHPSILFWSLFNEIKADPIDLVPELQQLAHEEDPNRATVGASNLGNDDLATYPTDLLAVNRYYGWYGGKPQDFARAMDETHSKLPNTLFAVSEYGAGASLFQHQDPPGLPDPQGRFHPEEWQTEFHETYYAMLEARPYLWASFVWNLFDFSSWGRHEGDRDGINDKGLVSYDRQTKKDAFYFYKAHWNPEPMLYITSRRFIERPLKMNRVKVYSNTGVPELSLNGLTLAPPQKAENFTYVWPQVTLRSGMNQIKVEARDASGAVLTDTVDWKAP